MRTRQLNRFMGAFIALTLTAGIAVSSNNFSGKGRNNTKNATCVNQISGLSQDQKTQMTSMESQHQATMNTLREKRQSTTEIAQKNQIRQEMDTQVNNHRNAVSALLNADQQKQLIQLRSNNSGKHQYRKGGDLQSQASVKEKGKGKGKGDGSGKQKGKGNGNGSSRNA
jgi:hypothetical protein